jgi:hypothetical protein
VYLPDEIATTSRPEIIGIVDIDSRQVDGVVEWYVKGKGSLHRLPPNVRSNIPTTSQFYKKYITVHEGRHVEQWNSIAPYKDLFDADRLYNGQLKNMTSRTSAQDLETKVQTAIDAENLQDKRIADFTSRDREKDAFDKSNAELPHYLEVELQ